jgi:hypothetical protein
MEPCVLLHKDISSEDASWPDASIETFPLSD